MNPLNPKQPRQDNPLRQLQGCGQSPWLDYLKRSLVERGELAELITRDGVKGLTSNPTIFEKAIGQSDEYAGAIKDFLRTTSSLAHLPGMRKRLAALEAKAEPAGGTDMGAE